MDIQVVIREVMDEQGVTMEALGSRVGVGRSAVCNSLGATQRSMGVEKAVAMLGALGYDLAAVPRGARLPKGARVVGPRG